MALQDLVVHKINNGSGTKGSIRYAVAASATLINSGEPVIKVIGSGTGVTPLQTNSPVVGTTFMAGVAVSTSTNTASVAGTVDVLPATSDTVFLIAPKVAATWATQALYDALVGSRVLIDLTSASYTVLASDSATNGCVIMPLDVVANPGKVAISFRDASNYLA